MDLADSALPLNDPRSASAVLVVEDEAVIAMEIESRLKVMGYRVVGCAASSQEALAIVARDRPDVILMDINIQGGRDGVEVANEMRRDHGIPSIFLTAYGDDATIRRAAESNPLSFLTKPFSDREVRAAIEIGLYRQAKEEELRRSREQLEKKNQELSEALASIRVLQGLLPMCAWCKHIRDDKGYWQEVADYLGAHTDADLSATVCPACAREFGLPFPHAQS